MAELPEGFVEKVWSNFRAAKERIEKLENRVEELERQNRSLKKTVANLQSQQSASGDRQEGNYIQECPVCMGLGSGLEENNDHKGRCATCQGKGKVRI